MAQYKKTAQKMEDKLRIYKYRGPRQTWDINNLDTVEGRSIKSCDFPDDNKYRGKFASRGGEYFVFYFKYYYLS